MRVADFFCGGGGFSEGFRQAGFQLVFAVDKWEPAVNTYKGNKPGVNAILDDVIRISELNDDEFDKLIPDTEVIIGSPPCQAFSHSNKSGKADKELGIKLIKAYLRIIARKKFKQGSILKYWVLENVPNVRNYIEESYTAKDLELEGDFILVAKSKSSGIYNAKHFGAPTNRERYLCGEFPIPKKTHEDNQVVTLRSVLEALGKPINATKKPIVDVNYPDLVLSYDELTDHHYVFGLQEFEWKTAKRLKLDKGYMGKMSFPENLDKPSRTVMATMSASSRESMILDDGEGGFRLPTVREAASMMSFPIDYRFYGSTASIKHTLVGNAVPPKLSYAIAKAIIEAESQNVPKHYKKITHSQEIPFINLNGKVFEAKKEKHKRDVSKFKYHIPYLILSAFRVELTNYHSEFDKKNFRWDAEIHYSQGQRAALYTPDFNEILIDKIHIKKIENYLYSISPHLLSFSEFQKVFCMTSTEREERDLWGPYELLDDIKKHIVQTISEDECCQLIESPAIQIKTKSKMRIGKVPMAILYGYYLLKKTIKIMEEKSNGRNDTQAKIN